MKPWNFEVIRLAFLYFEIFDLVVNLFSRLSGPSPFFILYDVISLSYIIELRKLSQSHTQPTLCHRNEVESATEEEIREGGQGSSTGLNVD